MCRKNVPFKIFVVVVLKEGLVSRAPPILLLVWHRLYNIVFGDCRFQIYSQCKKGDPSNPSFGTTTTKIFKKTCLCGLQLQRLPGATHMDLLLFQFTLSMLGCVVLTVSSLILPAPPSLPDLHAVMVSAFSCVHFLAFLLYFHYQQWVLLYCKICLGVPRVVL